MANPRKFSEKIALHTQKQAEETAAFEQIMREVSDATNKVNSNTRRSKLKQSPEPTESTLSPVQQGLGTFRSGSLPNVAAPQNKNVEPEIAQPEETTLATQYGINHGGRSGGTSPSRVPVQRGRTTSSSVGPMRNRPAERKHDTSPYGSSAYLSPPPDGGWRRTNSDSALHQSCGDQPPSPALSPHHPHHSHAYPHQNSHQSHRRATDMHLEPLSGLGVSTNSRPRSSCEIPRIPNNNAYGGGGCNDGGCNDGGGGAAGGTLHAEIQVPGGSLPDLTSVHLHYLTRHDHTVYQQSPTSPGGGSISPATGGVSPASGSPVGATVPAHLNHLNHLDQHRHDNSLYEIQKHLSVPNNYLHHNKSINSPLDQGGWIAKPYSPPSQYSSTSNINIPSPTMVHSPGSPVESPQTDYSNSHQVLLQPFEQITMMDNPPPNYTTAYINSTPHSPQTTNSPHTYTQGGGGGCGGGGCGGVRDPTVAGGGVYSDPPTSIPDIVLTDYGELEANIFGGEEAQIRAELDLDDLNLLEQPSSLLPDSVVEQEFRLDRL